MRSFHLGLTLLLLSCSLNDSDRVEEKSTMLISLVLEVVKGQSNTFRQVGLAMQRLEFPLENFDSQDQIVR